MFIQLCPSRLNWKLPIDFDCFLSSLCSNRQHFFFQFLLARNRSVQTQPSMDARRKLLFRAHVHWLVMPPLWETDQLFTKSPKTIPNWSSERTHQNCHHYYAESNAPPLAAPLSHLGASFGSGILKENLVERLPPEICLTCVYETVVGALVLRSISVKESVPAWLTYPTSTVLSRSLTLTRASWPTPSRWIFYFTCSVRRACCPAADWAKAGSALAV